MPPPPRAWFDQALFQPGRRSAVAALALSFLSVQQADPAKVLPLRKTLQNASCCILFRPPCCVLDQATPNRCSSLLHYTHKDGDRVVYLEVPFHSTAYRLRFSTLTRIARCRQVLTVVMENDQHMPMFNKFTVIRRTHLAMVNFRRSILRVRALLDEKARPANAQQRAMARRDRQFSRQSPSDQRLSHSVMIIRFIRAFHLCHLYLAPRVALLPICYSVTHPTQQLIRLLVLPATPGGGQFLSLIRGAREHGSHPGDALGARQQQHQAHNP